MLQANPNPSVLTVSPPESGFSPRREFIRDSHVPSSFALLAIAGAGFVRLSSFSPQLISSLKFAFESQDLLRGIREEPNLNLIEFNLEGKPWTQRKSAQSEKLFVQVLGIIFQHGYRFLSTIDYGRESSERVSIAFSRPTILSASEATRVPFALSFPSSTVLRVVNPPLGSSPAILGAARSAWPRGVLSEKKLSDKCFEFRLKGYSWFQEDTFSSDSMQHILALLNALDRHAFTLLTSISLTGSHSRVKDLWIFSGSPMEPSPDLPASNSNLELSRGLTPPGSRIPLTPVGTSSSQGHEDILHGRNASLPGSAQGSSHTLGHARSATDPSAALPKRSASVLRKKGLLTPSHDLLSSQPRFSRSSEEFPIRKRELTTIGSVDMTGIGSANQLKFSAARTDGNARSPLSRDFPRTSADSDPGPIYNELRQDGGRVRTGELFYETGPSVARDDIQHSPDAPRNDQRTPPHSSPGDSDSGSRRSSRRLAPRDSSEPPNDVPQSVSERVPSDIESITPPILGSRVFRDSAFSSSTNRSYEIPITWTGAPDGEKAREPYIVSFDRKPMQRDTSSPETDEGYGGSAENGPTSGQRPASTPRFPGAWQPTPIVEMPEDQGGLASTDSGKNINARPERSPERKEVGAEHVASPVLSDTPEATRKSEVALYSIVTKPGQPATEENRRSTTSGVPSTPTKGDGWVLVSVAEGGSDTRASGSSGERPKSPSTAARRSADSRSKSPGPVGPSLSPVVKAIAVEDAKKPSQNEAQSTFGLKRLFSVSKPRSRQSPAAALISAQNADARQRKPSLKERWRKKVPI